MYCFVNSKFDFCVIFNYWMYVCIEIGQLKFIRVDEGQVWESLQVLIGGDFDGEEVEWFELGKVLINVLGKVKKIFMDDWLEFLGYYIFKGYVDVRKRL